MEYIINVHHTKSWNIPTTIIGMIFDYYFMSNPYHEWRITDYSTIRHIKSAKVSYQLFSPQFIFPQCPKFRWTLELMPNGNEIKKGQTWLCLILSTLSPTILHSMVTMKLSLCHFDCLGLYSKSFDAKTAKMLQHVARVHSHCQLMMIYSTICYRFP